MNTYKLTLEIEDAFQMYATKEELEIALRDLLKINFTTLNLAMTRSEITKKRG